MPNIHDARATYLTSLAFLMSRDEIPLLLNARGLWGCGVEVGVKEGVFSAHLLDRWQGRHLISVDPWLEDASEKYVDIANVPQSEQEGFYQATLRRLEPFGERSTVWRTTSLDASQRIPRHSLDFVYLDARHDYDSVMEDLHAWFDRLRPGGILAGHDYLDGHLTAGIFGVKSAVDEFFAERDLAVYPTLDDEPWLSWMVELPVPGGVFAGVELGEDMAVDDTASETVEEAERVVSLSFQSNGRQHAVQLALDPRQMSQRIMLECFDESRMYEPETSQFFAAVLRPGDTFIDVGTHVGYFSVLASALVGPTGRVISFEPEASNYARLLRHVDMNRLENVEAVNQAVGESDHTAELFVNADNDGGHALWDVGEHPFNQRSRRSRETREVEVRSLDRFLEEREIGEVKLIKIDAEGSEHRVLLGARGYLERHPVPFVVVEINPFALERMGTSDREMRAMMAGLGYETFVFLPGETSLVRLEADQTVTSDSVYNVLFRHTSAAALEVAA